jgi:hypothetical protein
MQRMVRSLRVWRSEQGSTVAQAAAVALLTAVLISVIALSARSLNPAVDRAFTCLVAAITGGGNGCGGTGSATAGEPHGGSSDSGNGNESGGGWRGWLSAGLDFVPLLGEVANRIGKVIGTS